MEHRSYKIGAISFPNDGFKVWAESPDGNKAIAKIQETATQNRNIAGPPR
jgi:hypothetical protein